MTGRAAGESVFASAAFARTLWFPRGDDSDPPDGAVDRWIDAGDARVRLRVHRGERARCMVCFLGNGEVAGDYDEAAGELAALAGGLAVAFADYRGYGKTTGAPSYPALVDDARAVVAALARERSAEQLVLFGRSLGSQAVLHALAVVAPAAVVIDSGFSNLDAFVARRGLSAGLITADDRARYGVVERVAGYAGPVLGVHGAADTLIRPDDGRALVAASRHPASRFVAFAGRGHNDLSADDGYLPALDGWLTEQLAGGRG